ncbi:MAG: tyrosine-type recombinase/integrase [Christensenellales bacterium]|jgi:integrase/recombinase XerC
MESNYFAESKRQQFNKLQQLLSGLPSFCRMFFIGIEANTSALTRLGYARDLLVFFDFLIKEIPGFQGKSIDEITINDLANVQATHIEMFLSYLSYYKFNGKRLANNERAKSRKLSSVRSLFKYLYNKDLLPRDVSVKVRTPKLHEKEIIRLDENEIGSMLDNLDGANFPSQRQNVYNRHIKSRDNAIITLMLSTGIRISECAGLNLSDIDLDNNSFIVTRKGGSRSILYFSQETSEALSNYIDEREAKLTSMGQKTEGPLFLSLQNNRLGVRAIQNIVKKYAVISAPLKNISPHKLRSTYGTQLYRSTKDIYVVAEVLGHKDINTTKKHYAAISEDIKKEASNKVILRKQK